MSDKYKLIAKIGGATAALVVSTVLFMRGRCCALTATPSGSSRPVPATRGQSCERARHSRKSSAPRCSLWICSSTPRQAAHERRPESGFPELCIQRGQWYFLLEHAGAQGQRQGHAGRLRRAESLDLCRWQAAAWLGQSPRSRAQAV